MLALLPVLRPRTDLSTHSVYSINVCGCDSCWDTSLDQPALVYGPHDLHCICPSCMRDFDRFTDDQALDIFNHRYPELVKTVYSYSTPPNSPTNKEMHAYNGNHGHQHDNGSGSFLRAAARGLRPGASRPDRFAAGALAQTSLVGGGLMYAGFKDMGKPLNELRNQLFGKTRTTFRSLDYQDAPTIKLGKPKVHLKDPIDHAPSADFESSKGSFGMDTRFKLPSIKIRPRGPLKKIKDETPPSGDQNKKDKWDNPQLGAPQLDSLHDSIDPNHEQVHQSTTHPQGLTPVIISAEPPSNNIPDLPTGPTNQEMHTYNGNNLPRQRPYTKAQYERIIKKRIKRKAARKLKKVSGGKKGVTVNINTKSGIRKAHPRGEQRAVKKDNAEKRLAVRYTRLLKMPSVSPCRLGSTGNNPTKLLRGFYEITFNMTSPGFGANGTITATDLIVYLSPKMFGYFSSPSAYFSPITVGCATNSGQAFNNAAGATFMAPDFANVAALKNETGATASGVSVAPARFIAGHVSLICRCPMATTAPPYMYGGLLPSNLSLAAGTTVDPSTQLNTLTSTQIRMLNSTKECPGFEVSSVYVPGSAKNLDFSPNICNYSSTSLMDVTPIPYVGMSGCPATANVTVLVVGWFEVQQTTLNMNYGGFSLGPKISTEDIFDYLPRIQPVQPKALPLGTKGNSSSASTMVQLASFVRPPPPTIQEKFASLETQMDLLKAKFRELKVDVPDIIDFDPEEEKYFSEKEEKEFKFKESPAIHNLSKSTIDLALSLKEKLTPGSVTSKTVRNSLP